jgi:hypothetical protein
VVLLSLPTIRGLSWQKSARRRLKQLKKQKDAEVPDRGKRPAGLVPELQQRNRLVVKLQDYRNDSYTFSGKASDLNRQLGFAGIALIWLFKKDVSGQIVIPHILIWAGALIVVSLTPDMLHYCIGWYTWHSFFRKNEDAGVDENTELEHEPKLVYPIIGCFIAKVVSVIAAYVVILSFLIRTLVS